MNVEAAQQLARQGKLYPSVILHGAGREERLRAGVLLARTLLCEAAPDQRPCGSCLHCRRIGLEELGDEGFHPDFRSLARDLKTSTSVEATKELLRIAQVSPYEARGQVFLLLDADTLTDSAANALLKTLEEPPISAPRHFLLLSASAADLLPTLRSRSLQIFLGVGGHLGDAELEETLDELAGALRGWLGSSSPVYLLELARLLQGPGGFEDPRAGRPWSRAAQAAVRLSRTPQTSAAARRALLALAEDLLSASDMRLRGIPAGRIVEGLVARRLAGLRPQG